MPPSLPTEVWWRRARRDSSVFLWNPDSGQSLGVLNCESGILRGIAFSPDGKRIAAGGSDRTIAVWDVATRHLAARLAGHFQKVESVAFHPKNGLLVSGGNDRTVRRGIPQIGLELYTYLGHTFVIRHVLVSPDGRMLASASDDGTVRLWDVSDSATTFAPVDRGLLNHRRALDNIGRESHDAATVLLQEAMDLIGSELGATISERSVLSSIWAASSPATRGAPTDQKALRWCATRRRRSSINCPRAICGGWPLPTRFDCSKINRTP